MKNPCLPLTLAASLAAISSPALAASTPLNHGTLASVTTYPCASDACGFADALTYLLNTPVVAASDGGAGQNSAAVAMGTWPTSGSASGQVDLAAGLAVPVLKAGATGAANAWWSGQALGIQSYIYNGAGETLSLSWNLTGSVLNPDGDSSTGLAVYAAFIPAGQIAAFPDVSDPLGVAALLAGLADSEPTDDVKSFTATDAQVAEAGTISLVVSEGEQFYLLMGLLAGAGGQGAQAESLSTLVAGFDNLRGGLTPLLLPASNGVPLPGTLWLVLAGLAVAARRRG